jgi:hypothetical protein
VNQSSPLAASDDGVHFVDVLPDPPEGAVLLIHRLNGKDIAGIWVHPDHGGTPDKPFPELVEGCWAWFQRRQEVTSPAPASDDRPRPRLLELL